MSETPAFPNPMDAVYRRHFEAGKQACARETHTAIRQQAFDELWRQASDLGYDEGYAAGERRGALVALAGCLALAVVAGWLARRWGR